MQVASAGEALSRCRHLDSSATLRLRTWPDRLLRVVCQPVDAFDRSLLDLVAEMRQLMLRHRGIGLAAPQAGIGLRLFVGETDGRRLEIANPRVEARAGSLEKGVEGCLSLPGLEVAVARAPAVELSGWTPTGRRLSVEVEGLWARLVQHEVDHLDGRLICDHDRAAAGRRADGSRER